MAGGAARCGGHLHESAQNGKAHKAAGVASQIAVAMPSSCTYLRVACNAAAKELVGRCVDDRARTGIHRHLRRAYGDERDTVERAIRKRGNDAVDAASVWALSHTTELKLLSSSASSASTFKLGASAATIELSRLPKVDRRACAALCTVKTSSIGTNQT